MVNVIKKHLTTQDGFSLNQLVVYLVLVSFSAFVFQKSFSNMIKITLHNELMKQKNLVAQDILKRISCENSVATGNITDELTQCSSSSTPATHYFELRGAATDEFTGGVPILAALWVGGTPILTSGTWDLRASCFLRVTGASSKRCVFIEYARLDPKDLGKFRTDPLTSQPDSWKPLFDIPFCCDLANT